eukprot:2967616-Prymnesium_polylepis.1
MRHRGGPPPPRTPPRAADPHGPRGRTPSDPRGPPRGPSQTLRGPPLCGPPRTSAALAPLCRRAGGTGGMIR